MFGQLHTYTPFLQVYRKKQMDTLEAPDPFSIAGGDIVVIDDAELFLVGFQVADKAVLFQRRQGVFCTPLKVDGIQ